jgi:hypothetical protein
VINILYLRASSSTLQCSNVFRRVNAGLTEIESDLAEIESDLAETESDLTEIESGTSSQAAFLSLLLYLSLFLSSDLKNKIKYIGNA